MRQTMPIGVQHLHAFPLAGICLHGIQIGAQIGFGHSVCHALIKEIVYLAIIMRIIFLADGFGQGGLAAQQALPLGKGRSQQQKKC